MSSIPMAASTTNYESAKATVSAAAVAKSEASSTTLLTIASSKVESAYAEAVSTEAEPSHTKAATSTTAAPVAKTVYETQYITSIVYVTAEAPKLRRRSEHLAKHGVDRS